MQRPHTRREPRGKTHTSSRYGAPNASQSHVAWNRFDASAANILATPQSLGSPKRIDMAVIHYAEILGSMVIADRLHLAGRGKQRCISDRIKAITHDRTIAPSSRRAIQKPMARFGYLVRLALCEQLAEVGDRRVETLIERNRWLPAEFFLSQRDVGLALFRVVAGQRKMSDLRRAADFLQH